MSFRQKRSILLISVVMLFLLSILDVSIRKEDTIQAFSEQFVNNEKTDAYMGERRAVTAIAQLQSDNNKPEIKEVVLTSQRGKVSVQRSETSTIQLQATVTVTAASTEAANRRRDAVKVEQEIQNGQLMLVTTANGKSVDPDYVSIDYVLSVPDMMRTTIQNEDGAVRISGINGDVTATSTNGLMEIVNVKGDLKVKSSYGSLYMADIKGNLDLVNRSSTVNIDHTQGNLLLDHQSGKTDLTDITGEVTGNAKYGSVFFHEMKGAVSIAGQGSDMKFDHIQSDIQVVSVEGGNMTFILSKDEGYTLDAAVSRGRIQSLLPFPIQKGTDNEMETRMSGVLGKGTRKIVAKVASGDMIFQVN
ncbi:hypothetical protein PAECIP111891_06125 [Paenibacillus allorhizoplanae]|uniref:DUF4097 domain-containing protein n=1 Tax=Paenibacillus allorhizoplanae TaxID=2905648 RepID=A0ABN8H3V5_9BACL|nr:hypothetical protein [Paenibacillus allorhizoplanae]CAH1227338.1 hypothetical protein PAECIP111891_06125 [Paenibacillus allorhizoplanae]